jgi:hypothetical protein
VELRDFIVTPVVIIFVYVIAYLVRPRFTDPINRKYFLPALSIKIFGAIALGMLYQFYYHGGDTYLYHTRGSRLIWEAFMDSPHTGLKLLFAEDIDQPGIYKYASRILFFNDPQSYHVVCIAAVFDLLTFSTYSATAVLFSIISFTGMWMLFLTFYKQYPSLHLGLSIGTLFIPSMVIWGSGILKDTITLGCLGVATYCIYTLFIERRIKIGLVILLILSLYTIFSIKIFILQAYIPAALTWVMAKNFGVIRSVVLKIMLIPFVVVIILVSGYYVISKVGEGNKQYSINNIAETIRITAYDIGFYTGRDAGSGYSLGELDGTISGTLKLAPQAINVTLFRPYLWEVKNLLMLMSALESFGFLMFTLFLFFRKTKSFIKAFNDPNVLFCFIFSIVFAFAVGVSTYNFGTLARYKIPVLPFYFLGLVLVYHYAKRDKKVEEFEVTE